MKIAFGSDEKTPLTDFLLSELRRRAIDIQLVGPLAGADLQWVDVAQEVGGRVASGEADQGLLCCWTGTGVSMAANKIAGVRAALCADAETARGARAWNQANVLCFSLSKTSDIVAREILEAWFAAQPDPSEFANVEKLRELDLVYRSEAPARQRAGSG